MRRVVIAIASTISGLVLLFSYHTSTNQTASPVAATAGPQPGAGGSAAASTPSASSAPAPNGAQVVTGDPVQTRWGTVQVQITVSNGKIVQAKPVQEPDGNSHDLAVDEEAVPVLNQEAVSAQSAHIDAVSGATVTSDGYVQSLQSAIDAAHLS
jgi:uncharacterized protein with FMN-binding domain